VPHLLAMSSIRRLTALAVARAMLAGPHQADGLAARTAACLAARAAWQDPLAERLGRMPGERWKRMTTRSLASLIERDPGYERAWSSPNPPFARRYILREREGLNALPLGLERCKIPNWPNSAALAAWLRLSTGGMWRLTKASSWQRRAPLSQQHYHNKLLSKRTGGWRLLEVPLPYLRCLQRRLLDDLLDRVPPHEASLGFLRERSVLDHARAHAGRAVVLKFDLQDFFSSVRASRVHAIFATLGYAEEVARELTALCTTGTPEPVLRRMHEAGHLTWVQLQRLRDPHLPQGAPTSPALANLCAFRLDLRLDGLAYALGARYTRYADDLVISGGEHLRRVALRIEKWVGKIALEEGFALNHRKTRCLSRSQRQTVCGIVVNEGLNLPREEFDRLKAILHQCASTGPWTQNRDKVDPWKEVLRGKVAWVQQLNPAKAARLKTLFDRIDWSR
jgi:RNA-directed DNA polymerase